MIQAEDILEFDPHGHGLRSEGRIDGITVVVITKNKNHTHTNDGIYTVNVLGEELQNRFREIKEARDAARIAFAARVSSALTDDSITSIMSAIGPRPFHTGHFIDSLATIRPDLWSALIARYGKGGQGAGTHFSAFSAVAHALHRAAIRGVLDKLEEYVPAPPDLNWGSPVIRYWTGAGGFSDQPYPDEPSPEANYTEGAIIEVKVNRYERNRGARAACISHYGTVCQGCDMDFGSRYGERGRDFMHVHHLVPLKQIRKTYKVDPIADLKPVCPNCHSMIHRREPMLSIEELRAIIT
ncbi:HNH endonuclease [Pararhizobium gei]|uniref:HNH endonuclease n=1 Tax=Pararhizobium gei TaxID=1395951 RepID=UPI0023DC9B95|nr:HNH endonuclease [Rhizobium gei]